jgi:hypothetical protein
MFSHIGLLLLVIIGFFGLAGSCRATDTECFDGICGAVITEIDEPAFGLSYFPSQASFQKIPPESLGAACLELARKNFFIGGKVVPWLYLYAEYRNGDTQLIIVGRSDGTAIFVQRGQNCADGGVDVTFSQSRSNPPAPNDPPYLSQQEIQGVFADLLRRYAVAFGSKTRFFAWLDPYTEMVLDQCKGMSHAYCHPTWHDLPPDLQAMLEKFRQDGSG